MKNNRNKAVYRLWRYIPVVWALIFSVHAQAQHQKLTPTPPMGWNAWNCFNWEIDEVKIREIADAMVSRGMKDAGYEYVVIDDQWHKGRIAGSPYEYSRHPADITGRDAQGRLLVDEQKFPSGIKALADYVHSKGLKFGIYTAPGRKTCTYCPGSEGYEEIDIQTFADWGVDFIKLDWCEWVTEDYKTLLQKWRRLLDESERPMVLSVNFHRGDDFSEHRKAANMYRTTTDILKLWSFEPGEFRVQASVLDIIDRQEGLEEYHGNGAWCDPDMLQVGNEPLSYEENKSHFSMWAIFGAPLIAGNDLRTMSYKTRDILTNREVIAIAQDRPGSKV
ncbi:MAG: glycoside hydrolase family 27 protein [Cyclobacteriaceae bacterium]|nr:glycoside hydrolase family 27 protein [Cyclobacteriaceae bacterium]